MRDPGPTAVARSETRRQLTARFHAAWGEAVRALVEAGEIITEAKQRLSPDDFLAWLKDDLKLGKRAGQYLQAIAAHEVIRSAHHWCAMPASWRTLAELASIQPDRMRQLIAKGKIHPGMTRQDAHMLLRGRRHEKPPLEQTFILLLRIAMRHGGADRVHGFIRAPNKLRTKLSRQDYDHAIEWLRQQRPDA